HQPAVDMDSRCDWGRRRLSGWWGSPSGWKLLLRMRDAIIALCATPYMLVMKGSRTTNCSTRVLDPWSCAKLHLELALLSIAVDKCERNGIAWLGVQLKEGDHLSGRSDRRVVDLGED